MELQSASPARYWDLDQSKPVSAMPVNETAFSDDNRRPIPYEERYPGTPYYSIAQLRIEFASKPPEYGTGFMVSENILLTAGHCVWDKDQPAVRLFASFCRYEAYGPDYWYECRYGTTVLMSKYIDHSTDFALVILSKREPRCASTPIVPFRWYDTPLQNTARLYITGYPIDCDVWCRAMFEGSKVVSWNLPNEGGKLKYRISTCSGQSGSPILLADKKTFIGIHVAGGVAVNYGTPTANIGTIVGPDLLGSYERALTAKRFELITPGQAYGVGTVYDVTVPIQSITGGIQSQPKTPYLLDY